MVAKPGLMLTHLAGKHKLSGLSISIVNFDVPATHFLPGAESSSPSVIHDLDNPLQLYKKQRPVAWRKSARIMAFKESINTIYHGRKNA
jgi:hypothetical protein